MLAAGSGSGTNYLPLLLIAGLFILTYFMIIRPQGKRRRAMVAMQSSIAPGAEVITIGGLYATVVGTDSDTVDLEIAPGVNVTYARSAIARVNSVAEQAGAPDAEDVGVVEIANSETPSSTTKS
ncbi:MAG: preprotein translocase subunit YajC [Acidimicrobiales bacterium]|nr:MAG: preprotein translocase subunit YajC [Acidimicrobiales bacterium]